MTPVRIRAKQAVNRIRHASWGGVFLGLVALVACELPILLAALGLGGLSIGAMNLRPHPLVEKIAIVVAVLGTLLLIALTIIKFTTKRRVSK